jgi:hypothetical protein
MKNQVLTAASRPEPPGFDGLGPVSWPCWGRGPSITPTFHSMQFSCFRPPCLTSGLPLLQFLRIEKHHAIANILFGSSRSATFSGCG